MDLLDRLLRRLAVLRIENAMRRNAEEIVWRTKASANDAVHIGRLEEEQRRLHLKLAQRQAPHVLIEQTLRGMA